MIISVTGTPGVGKTTIAKLLAGILGYDYINLKEFAVSNGLGEPYGDEISIDVERLPEVARKKLKGKNAVVDSHLSHLIPSDVVIVLRTNPRVLGERLTERGYPRSKVADNVEAELIDLILVEALEFNKRVIEIDTTGKEPETVVNEILNLLNENTGKRVGVVDWSRYYDEVVKYLHVRGENENQ
ncbi:AAA family ATPase [Thermococcus sp.]